MAICTIPRHWILASFLSSSLPPSPLPSFTVLLWTFLSPCLHGQRQKFLVWRNHWILGCEYVWFIRQYQIALSKWLYKAQNNNLYLCHKCGKSLFVPWLLWKMNACVFLQSGEMASCGVRGQGLHSDWITILLICLFRVLSVRSYILQESLSPVRHY
jgi:hypothetical protein